MRHVEASSGVPHQLQCQISPIISALHVDDGNRCTRYFVRYLGPLEFVRPLHNVARGAKNCPSPYGDGFRLVQGTAAAPNAVAAGTGEPSAGAAPSSGRFYGRSRGHRHANCMIPFISTGSANGGETYARPPACPTAAAAHINACAYAGCRRRRHIRRPWESL